MFENSFWIKATRNTGEVCPVFKHEFCCKKEVKSAVLNISALGVYEAQINGSRVGDFVMAPGWTAYQERIQYQTYDVTDMLKDDNTIKVYLGKGWYSGRLVIYGYSECYGGVNALIAELNIEYQDGTTEQIVSNGSSWQYTKSGILSSEIYDGEVYDAAAEETDWKPAYNYKYSKQQLIPQEGEIVCEHEILKPVAMFTTPKGERVIDFGQNITGYVSFEIDAKIGEKLSYRHSEVLDKDGNFYTENLRTAKARIEYVCKDGIQSYKPHFTFMGFQYICLDEIPEGVTADNFKAIVVHSKMERTGYFECSNEKVNKLFENVIWGQKGNFLDIPTDCPQRDERLGWTGDAQIFIKTASYNFNVLKFFKKWLGDLKAEQMPDGSVTNIVPNVFNIHYTNGAGYSDAAVICPWQMYLTYNDTDILKNHIDSMKAWVDYVRRLGTEEYLWQGIGEFGDHLALNKSGINTRDEFISTAFYAYSTELVVKALKVLGDNEYKKYEELHANIVEKFCECFDDYYTQTECVLALQFGLTKDVKKTAAKLVDFIKKADDTMETGFIGTPYLLYTLSDNGYADIAYDLLLREEYPSWLFSVNMGATTIWEHWDSLNDKGEMWSPQMNSFNHYAYGSVASWMYEVICGIRPDEEKPGFEHIILNPIPSKRLEWAKATINTKYGEVTSGWHYEGDNVIFECDIPVTATLIIKDKKTELTAGKHKIVIM